ncbi:MAG: hypothetical protein HY047_01030 [Acidobacteria bacterium]|nr:hypothetical protein [Acidobacteriota bacterium]
MATQKPTHKRNRRALTLKIAGPGIHSGRISVPDLLAICQHAQSAVNRQAEAMEGKQTLRPGRKTEKVRVECTLELVSVRKGTTTLGFDLAKPQAVLPTMAAFGEEVIGKVVEAIESIGRENGGAVDPGVLDSLKNMGEVFDRKVTYIKWIALRRNGRGRRIATFNPEIRRRAMERLGPPVQQVIEIDGVLEMADFKPSDHRCRIHPPLGPSIGCTFDEDLADQVYSVLRQPVRVAGNAAINAQTGKTESVHITRITALKPLDMGAGNFLAGWTFEQLANMQAVEPLKSASELAGAWPDDEDVDQFLSDVYLQRA